MTDITPTKRSPIVTFWEKCECTQTASANIAGVSRRYVSQFITQQKQKATGSVTPRRKGKSERKRKTIPK